MGSVFSASLPSVTTMAAGAPTLATPVISSRRVMGTSVLFLVGRLSFQLLCVRNVGGDPRHSGFRTALETL